METHRFEHEPVMAAEIVAVFAAVPPGLVVDATVGGGGHASALLAAHPHLEVLGLDRDPAALSAARETLAPFGGRARLVHARFDRLTSIMTDFGLRSISGALFDLGVSSHQLDSAGRGFAYRHDAPLDMRMDPTEPWSAGDVVNGYTETELAHVLREHADERWASRIAKAIVAARPIQSTSELARVVVEAIPAPARRRGGHPAKRTFQAIRIEVNRELELLPGALDAAVSATHAGGRVAVLSYHSGEDRIVKDRFRFHETGGCHCPNDLPCVCGAVRTVRLVRAPRRPSAAEVEHNPRSSSARLRVVERLPDGGAAESER